MAKALKIILSIIFSIIGFIVLVLGGYIIYLCAQYYKIEDNQTLEISNPATNLVQTGTNYTITTYNIGFGAYTQDFSFFMDSGEMKDGTKTQGTGSRAKNQQTVLDNTAGAIKTIQAEDADFMFFQEVDIQATRSYSVNQHQSLVSSFDGFSSTSAIDFHSAYLFYPLSSPHGKTDSAISTFSKYKMDSAVRRSFPVDESFPNKFFDLDRCFSVHTLSLDGSDKKLVLINLHMSAYDEGGKIRAKQLDMLTTFIAEEYAKGNYVIAGGDWNHDVANSQNYFKTDEVKPDWVGQIGENDIPEGFSFASSVVDKNGNDTPTCRSTDIPYTLKTDENGNEYLSNYTIVIDGFLVSANVGVNSVYNINTNFLYSDHNPVCMSFYLKA